MPSLDIFNSTEHLEPRCPKCDCKIDYGVTTYYDEKVECHRCRNCDEEIK